MRAPALIINQWACPVWAKLVLIPADDLVEQVGTDD